jgi:Protein of unknown function (DUF3800)
MSNSVPQDFAFFADESGISQDRFTVVGGVCMHKSMTDGVYKSLARYREEHAMHSELKWSKVSNQKLDEYKALVDLFFALNNSNHVQFHSVVFDSHRWNHNKYNNGEFDIGLSKLYYQLLLHKYVKRCGTDGRSLFACLDHRNSSTRLEDLRKMLNAAAARDHGIHHSPLAQLISRDSKADCILQLNDVVLGAVCAIRNGKHLLDTTREAKRALALYVLEKSGLQTFERDSPRSVSRFTVWNMKGK